MNSDVGSAQRKMRPHRRDLETGGMMDAQASQGMGDGQWRGFGKAAQTKGGIAHRAGPLPKAGRPRAAACDLIKLSLSRAEMAEPSALSSDSIPI
jgi:hypothetical protein